MSDDKVPVIETITFLPDGGSHHVWRWPDGKVWFEQNFDVSPVLFQKKGAEWGLETAKDIGIEEVLRLTYVDPDTADIL